MNLPVILSSKGTSALAAPILKDQGGNIRIMPPLSSIPEEFTVRHFTINCTAVQFAKPGMSNHFYKLRFQLHWFGYLSRMLQERLARQVLLATPMGKWPGDRPRTRWSDCISDRAWSHLGVEPAQLFDIAVDCEVSRDLIGLLPLQPSQRKSGKENE